MSEPLLGNLAIKQALRTLRGQAYLITGAQGSGKKTLARLMAEKITGDRSGRAARGEHPDVLWLAPPGRGKQIPVDEVRALRQEAYRLPSEGERRALIIDRCEALGPGGQNALLKILEEPPAHAVFLLLATGREAMLPTVRSRCTIWTMEPVDAKEGVPFLQAHCPNKEGYETALRAAGGNLGRAMDYLEEGELLSHADIGVRLLGRLCRGWTLEADQLLSTLPKGEFLPFLESFSRLAHDFLLYKAGVDVQMLTFSESVLQIKGFLGRMKLEQLYGLAALALRTRQMLVNYGNEGLIRACFIAEMGELVH